jgi:hypothetical protein
MPKVCAVSRTLCGACAGRAHEVRRRAHSFAQSRGNTVSAHIPKIARMVGEPGLKAADATRNSKDALQLRS